MNKVDFPSSSQKALATRRQRKGVWADGFRATQHYFDAGQWRALKAMGVRQSIIGEALLKTTHSFTKHKITIWQRTDRKLVWLANGYHKQTPPLVVCVP